MSVVYFCAPKESGQTHRKSYSQCSAQVLKWIHTYNLKPMSYEELKESYLKQKKTNIIFATQMSLRGDKIQ